jgi:hypothetical protein
MTIHFTSGKTFSVPQEHEEFFRKVLAAPMTAHLQVLWDDNAHTTHLFSFNTDNITHITNE